MRIFITGIIHLVFGLTALSAQNIVQPDPIQNKIQEKLAGKIVFLNQSFPIEKYQKKI